MSHLTPHPTAYPEIDALLHRLLADARRVLGEAMVVALYLYGSLASGDFEPARSDVDFVVVTATEVPPARLPALEAMHAALGTSDLAWAKKLEGCYIPRDALRRYNPDDPPRPVVNEGRFYLGRMGSDWIIQRHIMREQGVVVAGPPPTTLIDPVTPDGLRGAVRASMHEWWAGHLDNPERLAERDYQAYAILTMCRVLHTLDTGEIGSKPLAARWAQQRLGTAWHAIIERALAWPHPPQPDHLPEALDLIRLTLNRSNAA